jgi:YD repeat-containing protein
LFPGLASSFAAQSPSFDQNVNNYVLLPNQGFNDTTTNIPILDRTAFRDRLDRWTLFGIDRGRRRTYVTDARTNTTHWSYCDCGALEQVQNALNQVTAFTNDFAGQRLSSKRLNSIGQVLASELYSYDLLGRLTARRDDVGQGVDYRYNLQGLPAKISDASGVLVQWQYDQRDRLTNRVDSSGVAVSQTYDNLNRVLTRTYPNNATEGFAYNAAGITIYSNQEVENKFPAYA